MELAAARNVSSSFGITARPAALVCADSKVLNPGARAADARLMGPKAQRTDPTVGTSFKRREKRSYGGVSRGQALQAWPGPAAPSKKRFVGQAPIGDTPVPDPVYPQMKKLSSWVAPLLRRQTKRGFFFASGMGFHPQRASRGSAGMQELR